MRSINAKVANVLSPTQIALNAGTDQGVRVGDNVRLYRAVRVTDPDSKEDLGGVQLTKLNLRVNHVQDRLCTAIVTDREAGTDINNVFFNITNIRPLKQITTKTGHPGPNSVFVDVGESAVVEGPEAVADDSERF